MVKSCPGIAPNLSFSLNTQLAARACRRRIEIGTFDLGYHKSGRAAYRKQKSAISIMKFVYVVYS